jgi:hypothetical protein
VCENLIEVRLDGEAWHERLETTAIYTQPTARDLEQAVRRLEAEPAD